MLIPKTIKVGDTVYAVLQPLTVRGHRQGFVHYGKCTISVANYSPITGTKYKPAERAEVFWHEVTHAILHDMQHQLRDDEPFVTAFSSRLSKAINSAQL
jgi:hypothetical protein